MSEASRNGTPAPLDADRRIDLTCRRFETAWKGRPRIEDYLDGWPEPARSALLRELLRLEVQFRRRRGEVCKVEDYHSRFPTLDVAWLAYMVAAPPTQSSDSATDVSGLMPPLQDCEVLELLGRGGMSEVYRARQGLLKREVALKMIRTNAGPREVELFRREAEMVARLKHVNIVQIHEIGERDGRPCLVLELVKGKRLYDRLDGRPQPGKAAAQLVQVLARAMHHAHLQGVVHCDLKPGNVLLADDGTPKITDFGISRFLESGTGQPHDGRAFGTPDYMAPEQAAARTDQIGPPTDVHALGAILYELITGWPPFKGYTRKETLRRVRSAQPIPPSLLHSHVHPDLETIILKCLQKLPKDRYASGEALADDLGRFLANEPILARPLNVLQRTARLLERPAHLDEAGRWGPATIGDAALMVFCHGIIFTLIRLGQSVELLWVWLLISESLGLWLFWYLVQRRHGRLTGTERDLRNLWVGYAIASLTLCWLYCPPFGEARIADALRAYPPLSVVVGVILFAEGRMYWGRLYLLGLAFFGLALLMPLVLEWSPLLLGGLYALTILCMGHFGRRAAAAALPTRLP